jgi:hypothetical protein
MAVALSKSNKSTSQVILSLMKLYSISERQASRYLQKGKQLKECAPIPEEKVVFTVKLPVSLIDRIRRQSCKRRQNISDLIAEALLKFLEKGDRSG